MIDSFQNTPPEGRRPGRFSGWAVFLATGLGVGWAPIAPGTVGSAIWGLPLALLVGCWNLPIQVATIVLVCGAGIPLCSAASRAIGRGKDPGSIVWDEIASMPITFLAVPMTGPGIVLVGFVLNRVFDIFKPPPARQLERLPAGLGIMADDWAAGVFSCLSLHLLIGCGILAT